MGRRRRRRFEEELHFVANDLSNRLLDDFPVQRLAPPMSELRLDCDLKAAAQGSEINSIDCETLHGPFIHPWLVVLLIVFLANMNLHLRAAADEGEFIGLCCGNNLALDWPTEEADDSSRVS